MKLLDFIIILITGIAAGFINVNAGGGSFLTIPMLIFTGLPAAVANGTNRVALTFANIIAVYNFKKKGFFNWKLGLSLGIPAALGSVAGAFISINLPDELYNTILAVVILLVLVVIIIDPKKYIKKNLLDTSLKNRIIGSIIFFFIGVYGGVIQAGVGFLIITSLVFITGYNLVKINSLKVLIALTYMVVSLLVFIFSGKVDWIYALVLSVGNGTGAFLGTRFAVKHGDKWIKVILFVAAFIMALKLLNVF